MALVVEGDPLFIMEVTVDLLNTVSPPVPSRGLTRSALRAGPPAPATIYFQASALQLGDF